MLFKQLDTDSATVDKTESSIEPIRVQYLEALLQMEKMNRFRPVTTLFCLRIGIILKNKKCKFNFQSHIALRKGPKMAADGRERFGIHLNRGNNFTENAGSDKRILQHTEYFLEGPEGPTTRTGIDIVQALHNSIQDGIILAHNQQSIVIFECYRV